MFLHCILHGRARDEKLWVTILKFLADSMHAMTCPNGPHKIHALHGYNYAVFLVQLITSDHTRLPLTIGMLLVAWVNLSFIDIRHKLMEVGGSL